MKEEDNREEKLSCLLYIGHLKGVGVTKKYFDTIFWREGIEKQMEY